MFFYSFYIFIDTENCFISAIILLLSIIKSFEWRKYKNEYRVKIDMLNCVKNNNIVVFIINLWTCFAMIEKEREREITWLQNLYVEQWL